MLNDVISTNGAYNRFGVSIKKKQSGKTGHLIFYQLENEMVLYPPSILIKT